MNIEEEDTLETLEERIHEVEHVILPEVVQLISEGRVEVRPNRTGSSCKIASVPKDLKELLMADPIIKRALLSVTDKTGITEFASALVKEFGVEIISTGGTARVLEEAGIPVTWIDAVTEFPEMMDGRVKTLHPRVHGGLLARRDLESHMSEAKEHGIEMIDMVVVNLYEFQKTVASGADFAEMHREHRYRRSFDAAQRGEEFRFGRASRYRSCAL